MGEPTLEARLHEREFAPCALLERFARDHPGAGGVASFAGHVRPAGVAALELTHYEPLTLPGMRALLATVGARWPLLGLAAHHRVGRCAPGEAIVLVAAAAEHRRAALEAVDCAMDHLKSAAWFWKRELTDVGWRWIEPTEADHAARRRWD